MKDQNPNVESNETSQEGVEWEEKKIDDDSLESVSGGTITLPIMEDVNAFVDGVKEGWNEERNDGDS